MKVHDGAARVRSSTTSAAIYNPSDQEGPSVDTRTGLFKTPVRALASSLNAFRPADGPQIQTESSRLTQQTLSVMK
jgi:hypothetical protein